MNQALLGLGSKYRGNTMGDGPPQSKEATATETAVMVPDYAPGKPGCFVLRDYLPMFDEHTLWDSYAMRQAEVMTWINYRSYVMPMLAAPEKQVRQYEMAVERYVNKAIECLDGCYLASAIRRGVGDEIQRGLELYGRMPQDQVEAWMKYILMRTEQRRTGYTAGWIRSLTTPQQELGDVLEAAMLFLTQKQHTWRWVCPSSLLAGVMTSLT